VENKESLDKMNMGKLWALARSRGIDFKGKKKKDLIAEMIAMDQKTEKVEKEVDRIKEEPKKETTKKNEALVEAVLSDGTKVLIPAKDITPAGKEKEKGIVIIKSVDGRDLEASVGNTHWLGKTIEVPIEQEDEVKRLLTEGGFYFV